jgi:hypothetical protein
MPMVPYMKKSAFVIMPFDVKFRPVYDVMIRPTLRDAGFSEVRRADRPPNARNILTDIMEGVGGADLVVADLTGLNANVFYELGVAHCLGQPVIHIKRRGGKVPFDLKQYTYIEYSRRLDPDFIAVLREMAERAAQGSLEYSNPVADFLRPELRRKPKSGLAPSYVTMLVFPEVISDERFSAGITIVNRSSALALGAGMSWSGTCTLTMLPGAGFTPSQFSTRSIPAGDAEHISLDGTPFRCQSGHIMACCRFPASGYCRLIERSPADGRVVTFYTADRVSEGPVDLGGFGAAASGRARR